MVQFFSLDILTCPLDRTTADRVDVWDREGNFVRTLHPPPVPNPEVPEAADSSIGDFEDDGDDWTMNGR